MVKNCDLGHSFSPYGPPSRQITYMYVAVTVVIHNFRKTVIDKQAMDRNKHRSSASGTKLYWSYNI